jgi:enolase-phosphatase E1
VAAPSGEGIRALLLDIEGTTTPASFVYDVLFPYARTHLRAFLGRHADDADVQGAIAALREERAADAKRGGAVPAWEDTLDGAAAYGRFLTDNDRKSTALKSLQGRVWEEGYRSGALRGEVFADVAPAFERWRRQGRDIAIFSSGSVLAQRLLFGSTAAGDLTSFVRDWFDTTTGPKWEAESYRLIARALGHEAPAILFISDVGRELEAAEAAGLATALCVRDGEAVAAPRGAIVATFDSVFP